MSRWGRRAIRATGAKASPHAQTTCTARSMPRNVSVGIATFTANVANSTAYHGARFFGFSFPAIRLPARLMTRTAAKTIVLTVQVPPKSRAMWTTALVSISMKPAPRKNMRPSCGHRWPGCWRRGAKLISSRRATPPMVAAPRNLGARMRQG